MKRASPGRWRGSCPLLRPRCCLFRHSSEKVATLPCGAANEGRVLAAAVMWSSGQLAEPAICGDIAFSDASHKRVGGPAQASRAHVRGCRAAGADRKRVGATDLRGQRGNRAHHTAGDRGRDRGLWCHRPWRKSFQLSRPYPRRSWSRTWTLQRRGSPRQLWKHPCASEP